MLLFGQTGIVEIHFTFQELGVKLDQRIRTILRKHFYLSRAWKHVLRLSLKRFSTHRTVFFGLGGGLNRGEVRRGAGLDRGWWLQTVKRGDAL